MPSSLETDRSMPGRDRARNPKLLAIASHATQARGQPGSHVFGFARSDEPFLPEELGARARSGRTGNVVEVSLRR